MLPQTAYQIIHDEVMLDGNARFNLATFVGTWMDEYPQTAEIEERCVRIFADLWNAPDAIEATGTSTTGSSEGCMLGGLAMKRRWQPSAGGKASAWWDDLRRPRVNLSNLSALAPPSALRLLPERHTWNNRDFRRRLGVHFR